MDHQHYHIVGDPHQLAWEFAWHSESSRLRMRSYGMFRLWIRGVAFGRADSDATGLACSFDNLERLHKLSLDWSPFSEFLSPQQWLSVLYSTTYNTREINESASLSLDVKYAHQLAIAPDGDEAFDDLSHAFVVPVHDNVLVVGCRVQSVPSAQFHLADNLFVSSNGTLTRLTDIATTTLSQTEYQEILSKCIAIIASHEASG